MRIFLTVTGYSRLYACVSQQRRKGAWGLLTDKGRARRGGYCWWEHEKKEAFRLNPANSQTSQSAPQKGAKRFDGGQYLAPSA